MFSRATYFVQRAFFLYTPRRCNGFVETIHYAKLNEEEENILIISGMVWASNTSSFFKIFHILLRINDDDYR